MTDALDMDLVREFARSQSEAAFTELVRRHINLVYSIARRCTTSDSDAQDVTQAVFAILARKAAGLRARTVLTGWLYETTRYTAACVQRTNVRRHAREQEAYMQSILPDAETAEAWSRLAPHLEAAMSQLGERDRALLALRFYENKSGPEAAALLGIQEAAAHKRTARALEKLRKFFARRGVALSAAAIAGAVSANSVQAAPAGLAAALTAAALSGTAITTTAFIAATKAIAMTTIQKIAVTAALTVTIGGGIYATKQAHDAQNDLRTLQAKQAPLTEQIQQLQSERNEATNRLAGLRDELANANKNNLELLKLRGKSAQMQTAVQEYTRLKAHEQLAELGDDEKAWLERVHLLKQRMAETPAAAIPELKYLTDDDWLRTAKRKLSTEEDYRSALAELGANAEGNYLRTVEVALRKYLDANNAQFPTEISQLKSFLTNAADGDILQRYQIQPAKDFAGANIGSAAGDYMITPKQAIGDSLWMLSRDGVGVTGYSSADLLNILAPALKALSDATPMINGRRAMDIHKLTPYLTTPEQKAAYQKLMDDSSGK